LHQEAITVGGGVPTLAVHTSQLKEISLLTKTAKKIKHLRLWRQDAV